MAFEALDVFGGGGMGTIGEKRNERQSDHR